MNTKNSKSDNIILGKMQVICSRQERCTSEIRRKLAGYDMSEHKIEKIIEMLKKENYINDERYAVSFAHDKFRFNKWGKIKIEYKLKQAGISDVYILKALESIDGKEYLHIVRAELFKKFKRDKSSGTYIVKSKLMRFARSKGFETELAYDIIDEILSTSK